MSVCVCMCVFVAILWLRSNAVMGLVVSECDFPNLLPLTIALPITSLSLPLFPLSLFHPPPKCALNGCIFGRVPSFGKWFVYSYHFCIINISWVNHRQVVSALAHFPFPIPHSPFSWNVHAWPWLCIKLFPCVCYMYNESVEIAHTNPICYVNLEHISIFNNTSRTHAQNMNMYMCTCIATDS